MPIPPHQGMKKNLPLGILHNRHLLMLRHRPIELIQRLQPGALLEQDIALHPIRQRLRKLIAHMGPSRHRKHVIELLEGALLGLGDPEEDHDEGGEVQAGVEAEGADGVEGAEEAREGDAEDGGPEEAGGDGPGHADLAVREREDFGAVGEGHGAFAGGVEGREEEDEEGDEPEVGVGFLRDDEAEPRREEGPGHLREGEEQERASAVGVDGPDGGPGEDEVDEAEAEGGEQGLEAAGAGVDEDGRGVEGDDVDAAHLLRQHDGEGRQRGAAHARDGEELDKAGHVVGFADDVAFFLDLGENVVKVARGLELRVAESAERLEGVTVAAFFDKPAGRFGAEVHAKDEWDGGDECRAKLETPGDCSDVVDCQVGAESEEDAESGPPA